MRPSLPRPRRAHYAAIPPAAVRFSSALRISHGHPRRISLRDNRFSPEKVVIREGDRLRWRFADATPHNLTFANGPSAVGGQTLARGATAETRFTAPGRYQLFCYLHPMTMREQVTVLPR